MKDNFSSQADAYLRFRPSYPKELLQLISKIVPNKDAVWDVGTGNGQLAVMLSDLFQNVYATDISERQLQNAIARPNIQYSKQSAELTNFSSNQFDLIAIAQAIHWFDFEAFYREVKRTLKQGGVIVIVGYGLVRVNKEIDLIIDRFYHEIVGPYWDLERRYVDEAYSTIPFPFEEVIDTPQIKLESDMSLEQLLGYLNSWSAVQHYKNDNGTNPLDQIQDNLREVWVSETFEVTHSFFMRIGKNV